MNKKPDFSLSSLDLPESVIECYKETGNIRQLFEWQAECLRLALREDHRNLVYSAPTSAGKTLVAETLTLKRLLSSGRKALFVLPFVALAREKMHSLQVGN